MPTMQKSRFRKLMVENLEQRCLLTGNVTADFFANDHVLHITGDARSNSVMIERNGDRITVSGGGTTTVNQHTSTSFSASSIDDIIISMGGGDDVVSVRGRNDSMKLFARDIEVYGGTGNDTIKVSNCSISDDLFIRTDRQFDATSQNAGADKVTVSDCSVSDKTNILTGNGRDTVTLDRVKTHDDIIIDTADDKSVSDADEVRLTDVRCSFRNFHFDQGTLKVSTGGGRDVVSLKNVQSDFVEIDTGSGADSVNLRFVSFDNDGSYIDGGSGEDLINRFLNGGDGLGNVKFKHFELFSSRNKA